MARSKPKTDGGTKAPPQSALSMSHSRLAEAARLIDSGRLPEAAAVLDDLQSKVQGDPRIYMMGMRLAEASGRPEAALDAARLAARIAPRWAPAVLDLALCLARRNQFREAAAEAEKAVELAPDQLAAVDGAIQVAHRAGYAELALKHLPKAIVLSAPDNAAYRRMQGRDLTAVGRYAEAIAAFDALLADFPDDAAALEGRAQAALAAGDRAAAVADWKALLARHPDDEGFRYHLAVAEGVPPGTQPASLPRALFDDLAPVYDHHMVRDLKYQLPKEVAGWILERFPERKLDVLDLGCGTGLLGVCLGRLDGFLIGVDVSEKMIEQAARHELYHRFHRANLLDALRETPAGLYDVVAALDVFIYSGELGEAIPNGHRVTRPGGYFVFSCESAEEDGPDWVLRPTNRYAHRRSHVESLCADAGFTEVELRETTLRLEGGQPVEGFVVTARKGAAA